MNIVFVHLNSPIPKFLIENLKRTAEIFHHKKVFLITDVVQNESRLSEINFFYDIRKNDYTTLQKLLAHPKQFRNNFSFTSVARFLALANFSSLEPGEMLHVESDVILSEDFPFSILGKKGRQIACPLINEELAIASVLYLRNKKSALLLREHTLRSARENPYTTDMHILREISKRERNLFQILPTVPSIDEVLPDVSNEFFHENALAIDEFQNLFDGGDLGRYLFGDDPRNWGGRPPIRHNASLTYYDIRNLSLIMDHSRSFPSVKIHEKESLIPIHSLHIHSKQIKIFKSSKQAKYIKNSVKKFHSPTKHKLYLRIYIRAKFRKFKIYKSIFGEISS